MYDPLFTITLPAVAKHSTVISVWARSKKERKHKIQSKAIFFFKKKKWFEAFRYEEYKVLYTNDTKTALRRMYGVEPY